MKKEKFTFFEENPEFYEEGFSYRAINNQVNFLNKIFSKNKCKKILDIACGHSPQGRLLAKKGFDISGIDLSESLLKLGRKRAQKEKVNVKFYKKDMSNFNLGKFDGAYILFSSILHLYKKEDLFSHFQSVNKNLRKGGLYIIDLSSLPFDSPFKSKEIKHSRGKLKTILNYSPKDTQNLIASFKQKSIFNGKIVNQEEFNVLMFLPLPLLFSLAKSNGFEIKKLYSNFEFNKNLNKKRPEYIVVLRKK